MPYRDAIFKPDWLKTKDPRCRVIATDYWWDYSRMVLTDNPNERDIDMLISFQDCPYHAVLELEWTAERNRFSKGRYRSKWNEVSVPIRKEKWFRSHKRTYWMGFSYDFNHYILMPGHIILGYNKRRKYSVYNNPTEEEEFFMIPQTDPHTEPKPVPHYILKKHNIHIV